MIARTWPYGTRKRIRVKQINRPRGSVVVMAKHLDEREATILVISPEQFRAITPPVEQLQVRVMEFRQGGPTGGHWMILNESEVAAC